MTTQDTGKIIGRAVSCDLILEDATVSRWHAQLELAEDGYLWLCDNHSSNGTFLGRQGQWVRVERATLCEEDRVRFGDREVPVEGLLALFEPPAGARLRNRQAMFLQSSGSPAGSQGGLNKPRRNPVTGVIEEDTL